MRLVILLLSISALQAQQSQQLSQQRGGGPPTVQIIPPSQFVEQQPAQDITLHLTSDLVTMLEKARRDTLKQIQNPTTGGVDLVPAFSNLSEFLSYVLSSPGGFFRQLAQRYPPASLKAKADAKAQADKDAAAAEEKLFAPTKETPK